MDSDGWEIKRHCVALCGRVLNSDGTGAECATVTITDAPKKFTARLRSVAERGTGGPYYVSPDAVRVRPDGIYFFLDLPEGEYAVAARGTYDHERAKSRGKVVRRKDGTLQRAVLDMQFPSS